MIISFKTIATKNTNVFACFRCTVTNASRQNSLKFSQRYRSVLKSVIDTNSDNEQEEQKGEKLSEKEAKEREERNMSEAIRNSLSVVDLVWSLAESLYFNESPFVVKNLIDWIQQHTSTDPNMLKAALKCKFHDSKSSRNFWNILLKLLTQGFFREAIALLNVLSDFFHEKYNSGADLIGIGNFGMGDQRDSDKSCTQWKLVQDIIMLLKQNPISSCSQYSTVELNSFAAMWRNSFQELKVIAEACDEPELTLVCGLCAGERSVLNKIMKDDGAGESSIGVVFERWFECIIAFAIFIVPSMSKHDLAKVMPSIMQSSAIDSPLDHVIHALFTADNLKIVYHICTVFPETCTAMHLVDLFYYSGYKLSDPGSNEKELKEDFLTFLTKDYGTKLMLHSSLWPFAFTYLMQLDRNQDSLEVSRRSSSFYDKNQIGSSMLYELIERIEPINDQQAVSLISMCLKYELQDSVCSINRKRAVAYLNCNNLLNASQWTVRCLDLEIATKLAHECLKLYLETRDIDSIAGILENLSGVAKVKLGTIGKQSEGSLLNMVCMFYEYLKCKTVDADFKRAGSLLMSLIRCPNIPQVLQLSLLLDSCDFVSLNLINSSDDIFALKVAMENFHPNSSKMTVEMNEKTTKELKILLSLLQC